MDVRKNASHLNLLDSITVSIDRDFDSKDERPIESKYPLVNHFKEFNERQLGFVPPSTTFDDPKFNLEKDCTLYLG